MQGCWRDAAVHVAAELESRDRELRLVSSDQDSNMTESDVMGKRRPVMSQVSLVRRPIEVY